MVCNDIQGVEMLGILGVLLLVGAVFLAAIGVFSLASGNIPDALVGAAGAWACWSAAGSASYWNNRY